MTRINFLFCDDLENNDILFFQKNIIPMRVVMQYAEFELTFADGDEQRFHTALKQASKARSCVRQ